MSVEQDVQPELLAMIGSSAALAISEAPFAGPTGSVAVGMIVPTLWRKLARNDDPHGKNKTTN